MEVILQRIRKINQTFMKKSAAKLSLEEVCEVLAEIMSGNVFIYSLKGKLLSDFCNEPDDVVVLEDIGRNMSASVSRRLEEIEETRVNLLDKETLVIFRECLSENSLRKYHTLVPIFIRGDRLGTLVFSRYGPEFSVDDVIVAEYVAVAVGMEIEKRKLWSGAEKKRSSSAAQNAMMCLSGSEKMALQYIFRQLEESGKDRIFSSNVADALNLGRATVGNALRKASGAGVIRVQSYGAKGTGIKLLNQEFVRIVMNEVL